MGKLDLLSVLEAAYAPAGTDGDWLANVLEAAAPALDRGLGVVATFYELGPGAKIRFAPPIASSDEAMRFAAIAGRVEGEPNTREITERLWVRSEPFSTASERTGLGAKWPKHPAIAKHHGAIGVRDVIGLITSDPTGAGCSILVPLRRVWSPPRREVEIWGRVAAHLAAGLRLRHPRKPASTEEAIMSPSGKIEHAEAAARSKEALAALARGARAMDRARGNMRKHDPEEAIAIWRGLVAGRWSLVDSFDHDGRRYIIARRNDATTPAWRLLSERERQIVAFAALGHSNKLIAYELGLSLSTVAMHLSRASAKLGARSRVELIQAYASRFSF